MKYLVPVLIVIIIIFVGGLSFFLGKSGTFIKTGPATTPTLTGTPSGTGTATTTPIRKVTGGGILSFPRYELTVPTDWTETRESQGQDDEKIILTKGAYSISITQGGFGGAVCLFPGDADIEGPSARYDAYKELTTLSGDKFRRSWTGEEMASKGYGICHQSQYGWGAPTNYGHVSFGTPVGKTREMLDEMDAILSSLKKI